MCGCARAAQSLLVGESELALKFAVGSPLEPSEMLSTVYGAWSKSLGLATEPEPVAEVDPRFTGFAGGGSPTTMMMDSPASFGLRGLPGVRRGQATTPSTVMDSARTRSPFVPGNAPQVTLANPPVGRFRRASLESASLLVTHRRRSEANSARAMPPPGRSPQPQRRAQRHLTSARLL